MPSTATGALQWGNNVAVKQRGCDSPSTLHALSLSLYLSLSLSRSGHRRRGAHPLPFFLFKAAPRRVGLETDSFSPQHLICGNRCSTAENCAERERERERERCERHIRQKCSSSVERSKMPEWPRPSVRPSGGCWIKRERRRRRRVCGRGCNSREQVHGMERTEYDAAHCTLMTYCR